MRFNELKRRFFCPGREKVAKKCYLPVTGPLKVVEHVYFIKNFDGRNLHR